MKQFLYCFHYFVKLKCLQISSIRQHQLDGSRRYLWDLLDDSPAWSGPWHQNPEEGKYT